MPEETEMQRASRLPIHESSGFANLLERIVSRCRAQCTLKEIEQEVLTLGGRLPYKLGRDSLTARELLAIHHCAHFVVKASDGALKGDCTKWFVSIQCQAGKLLIGPEIDECTALRIGTMEVPHALHERLQAQIEELEALHRRYDHEVNSFFAAIGESSQITTVLEKVRESLDHIDQVLLYVDDAVFTNLDGHNNLMHRTSPRTPSYVLPKLFESSVNKWSLSEKYFVFCLWWIVQAGFRCEEFNGRQLTPSTLLRHLRLKRREYQAALADSTADGAQSIADLANSVSGLRRQMQRSYKCSRWIHGLTFYKEERWILGDSKVCASEVPYDLRYYIESTLDVKLEASRTIEEYFIQAAFAALQVGSCHSRWGIVSGLEALIIAIVESAVSHTDSDMGMSRGVRSLAQWWKAWEEQSYSHLCGLPVSAYYCFVTTSHDYSLRLTSSELSKAVTAVAKRMQFNSWHYAASYVPAIAVPDGRHYFYSPSMPDRAEWSDQHHSGHKLVGSRYTMRFPYPLSFQSTHFNGLGDLRLMRQYGTPYSETEFRTASQFAQYLRLVNQSVCDQVASGTKVAPVTAFSEEWYKNFADLQLEKHCRNVFAVGHGIG